MRKWLLTIFVLGLTFFLVGCFNLIQIKSDFESIGYDPVSGTEGIIEDVMTAFDDDGIMVHCSGYSDGVNYAILLEFDSRATLDEQLDSNEALQYVLSSYETSELVERNFLMIPVTGSEETAEVMISIFHGSYVPDLEE